MTAAYNQRWICGDLWTIIKRHGPVALAEIAKRAKVSTSSCSRSLNLMVRRGYITAHGPRGKWVYTVNKLSPPPHDGRQVGNKKRPPAPVVHKPTITALDLAWPSTIGFTYQHKPPD